MPQSKHKQLEKQQHSGLQEQNNGHHNTTDSRIDSRGYKYASAGQQNDENANFEMPPMAAK